MIRSIVERTGAKIDLGFDGVEDAVEAAEHREGEDHPAVLGLLVVAAQQLGHRPDEPGVVVVLFAYLGHRTP
jgi:hypothetical protein